MYRCALPRPGRAEEQRSLSYPRRRLLATHVFPGAIIPAGSGRGEGNVQQTKSKPIRLLRRAPTTRIQRLESGPAMEWRWRRTAESAAKKIGPMCAERGSREKLGRALGSGARLIVNSCPSEIPLHLQFNPRPAALRTSALAS